MSVTVKCKWCGKEKKVSPSKANRPYCSQKCATLSFFKRTIIHCETCGKEMSVTPSELKQGRKYCSRICAGNGDAQRFPNPRLKECLRCHEQFLARFTSQIICAKCEEYLYSVAYRLNLKVKRICIGCGKEFVTNYRAALYHSKSCATKHKERNKKKAVKDLIEENTKLMKRIEQLKIEVNDLNTKLTFYKGRSKAKSDTIEDLKLILERIDEPNLTPKEFARWPVKQEE